MLPISGKLHCRKHCQAMSLTTTKKVCRGLNQHCGHNTSRTLIQPKDIKTQLIQKRNDESQDGSCEFRVTPTLKTYAGPRQKHSIMGPHQLKVCRICFAMDCQLHLLIGNVKLYKGYEAMTGLMLADEEDLPPYLCSSCADQLVTCARFRHRSLQAHLTLLDILKNHDHISLEIIQEVIKLQTPIDYDMVIESASKDKTGFSNNNRGDVTTDGIKKEINHENEKSIDIPVLTLKTEIEDSNEGKYSLVSKIKKETVDMNMDCEEPIVDSLKRATEDVNEGCEATITVNSTETKFNEINIQCDDITSVNNTKTIINESNKDVNININNIKGEVGDGNKMCKNIAKATIKTKANEACGEATVKNMETIDNGFNDSGEINESRKTKVRDKNTEGEVSIISKIKTKINDSNEGSSETTVNRLEPRISDVYKEGMVKPNEIKTEINPDVQYNDISIEIIKTEVNDEADEIPNEITANNDIPSPDTYEVAVVSRVKGINDMVTSNTLHDELINDVGDREGATGEHGLADGLPMRQEDKMNMAEESEGMIMEENLLQEREINSSCDICEKINSENSSSEIANEKCDCINSDLNKSNIVSDSDKPYMCKVCKKKFTRKGSLVVHLRVHNEDNPFLCSICKKSFTRQTNLDDHLRLHSGDRPFTCDLCKKTYIRKSSLEEHLRNHAGDKPFKCTVCKKAFTRKNGLDEHFRIHSGDKPFLCPVCERAFSRKRRLEEHMRKHSTNNPLYCDICKKSFTRKGNLEEHLRNHAGVKPFMCKLCKKAFTRKSSLLDHVRTHSGNKPFLCNICKKSFTRKNNLDDHIRTHSGNKPYSCDVCNKSFCLNGNLQKHMMIHYGDKPYPCHLCDNSFRQKSHLQRHLLTHSSGHSIA